MEIIEFGIFKVKDRLKGTKRPIMTSTVYGHKSEDKGTNNTVYRLAWPASTFGEKLTSIGSLLDSSVRRRHYGG